MYIGALKFSHSYFNVYVARVAALGFFYTCLRSAPALLDLKEILENLEHYERAIDRPDIVVKVFHQKVQEFERNIRKFRTLWNSNRST